MIKQQTGNKLIENKDIQNGILRLFFLSKKLINLKIYLNSTPFEPKAYGPFYL